MSRSFYGPTRDAPGRPVDCPPLVKIEIGVLERKFVRDGVEPLHVPLSLQSTVHWPPLPSQLRLVHP